MVAAESNVAQSRRTPVHLWIVGGLSLLWNLVGVWDYTATKLRFEFYLSQFPEEMMAFVAPRPKRRP